MRKKLIALFVIVLAMSSAVLAQSVSKRSEYKIEDAATGEIQSQLIEIEFAPEPDGSISLDWIRSRSNFFSVSVGASDRLAYAWLDGTDRGHAVARFDGDSVPSRILEGIKALVQGANAAVRPR